ncbi:MAG: PLP-dependent aminotransferase family protein [Bryobacterales bacterium]|nr:PLP-dependent aminotransferase family protein [Bryobacterales bacterium]
MWSNVRLDAASHTPLYRQLYEQIRDRILNGGLADGMRRPATRELAGLLRLNRTTVSAAYELLEKDGLVRGHVGRGSFVAKPSAVPPVQPPRPRVDVEWTAPRAATSPELISFASSRPAGDLFPLDDFRQTVAEVSGSPQLASILQLGSPLGYEPLRHWLRAELRGSQTAGPDDDVLMSSGCQQAMDLLVRTLIQPGDLVMLEDPIYPGLREVLHRAGARLAGIPVTAAGLDLDEAARVFRRERVKALFVTPSFQNPTGSTLSRAARLDLLRLAAQAGAVVVENDVYSPLRYEGEPIPSMKQLAQPGEGELVQVGSFSKIAFPGLRVGWILGPARLIDTCAAGKQWMDLHSDQLSQAVLLRFAESGRLEAHRRRVLEAGASRLAATLAACEAHLPDGCGFTRPQGGMNLWVRLPEPLDTAALLRLAEEQGVTYLPGRYFAVGRPDPGGLRLSFAGLDEVRIARGVEILGGLVAAELRRTAGYGLGNGLSRPAPAMV